MFVAPEEVIDYFYDKFQDEGPQLGIMYIARYEEELLPKYPALRITPGTLGKDVHGTHKFQNDFNVDFWIYHARLSAGHGTRSREDMLLCTEIRQLLHTDLTLAGNIIFGYVITEIPGITNRPKGAAVVGTRMVWSGLGQEMF